MTRVARARFFPMRHAKRMLAEFGGPVDMVEIPDGRLFVHEDRAEAFAPRAKEFLLACHGEEKVMPSAAGRTNAVEAGP